MTLNLAMMIGWISLLALRRDWGALAAGTVVFVLILVGLSIYMVLTIKEVRLNQRQANFVDSVTHELKSPIATLRLYLDTLSMRSVDDERRGEFYAVMEEELQRLDGLINQLLEVGRLDAIGQQADPEDILLEDVLRACAKAACARHKQVEEEVVRYDLEPAVVPGRRMVLDMIFGNLIENATKYAAEDPKVEVRVRVTRAGKVVTRICDNGVGVPAEMRKKIFRLFFRGGNELERRQKGTGLGLYIVQTLVHTLKGKVRVQDRQGQSGCVFEVELPGWAARCES